MKIRVTKHGNEYRAEAVDLPGTPPNGLGCNLDAAIGNLVRALIVIEVDDQTKDLADRITEKLWEQWGRLDKKSVAPIIRKVLEAEPNAPTGPSDNVQCETCAYENLRLECWPCCACNGLHRPLRWKQK